MSKLVNDRPAFMQAARNKKDLAAWKQTAASQKDMHSVKSYGSPRRAGGKVHFAEGTHKRDQAMVRESHQRVAQIQPSGVIC